MGNNVAEVLNTLPPPRALKVPAVNFLVHRQMCTELLKLVEGVGKIFPKIEAARPGCSAGIQALCSLSIAIEKAKLLIQDCIESSKLYLAIKGDVIQTRCKKARNSLYQNLSQIQHEVPVILAAEISRIISDLESVTFDLDPSEEEAGKVMKTLLQQYTSATDSIEESAIQSIRITASKLHITSRKDFLIEKRSIKKLIDKVGDGSPAKKKLLIFLLNLLKKYENSVVGGQIENACVEHEDSISFMSSHDHQSAEMESCIKYGPHDAQIDMLNRPTPPEDFRCPLSSRLLYDPVVIDSGQTFERMWIQKWFNEGNDTCPKTKRKLSHLSLTPNVTMKNLISKWCTAYGVTIPDPFMQSKAIHPPETSLTSIASLSNSMHNLCLPVDFSNVSVGSLDTSQTSDSSFAKITDSTDYLLMKTKGDSHTLTRANNHTRDGKYLHKLDALPWESQCKMVEDVKIHLKDDDQDVQFTARENFVEPLVKFLKVALDLNDAKAQRAGCLLLLAFVTKCRSNGQHLNEGVYGLLASFFNSEVAEEAVSIVEVLSHHQYSRSKIAASGAISSILQILEMQNRELHEPAIRILYNLSFDSDIHSHIVSTQFVRKLVPYFKDGFLARYCISILKNLCDHEHTRVSIVETDGCIASIANVLELGNSENQEHAVTVLLSLCSQSDQYCQLVMGEGVIPALVSISINGNDKGKASAMELLRLFRDIKYNDDIQECPRYDIVFSRDSGNYIKEQKPSSKPTTGFFRKIFSKSAPKKKR